MGIFCHSSLQILSRSVKLDEDRQWTAIFRSLQRCSIGFKSGHSRTLLSLIHSCIVSLRRGFRLAIKPRSVECFSDGCPSGSFSHLHTGSLELSRSDHRVLGLRLSPYLLCAFPFSFLRRVFIVQLFIFPLCYRLSAVVVVPVLVSSPVIPVPSVWDLPRTTWFPYCTHLLVIFTFAHRLQGFSALQFSTHFSPTRFLWSAFIHWLFNLSLLSPPPCHFRFGSHMVFIIPLMLLLLVTCHLLFSHCMLISSIHSTWVLVFIFSARSSACVKPSVLWSLYLSRCLSSPQYLLFSCPHIQPVPVLVPYGSWPATCPYHSVRASEVSWIPVLLQRGFFWICYFLTLPLYIRALLNASCVEHSPYSGLPPFRNCRGHCALGNLHAADFFFVGFPWSVPQYNPVSELCRQFLWPYGLVLAPGPMVWEGPCLSVSHAFLYQYDHFFYRSSYFNHRKITCRLHLLNQWCVFIYPQISKVVTLSFYNILWSCKM